MRLNKNCTNKYIYKFHIYIYVYRKSGVGSHVMNWNVTDWELGAKFATSQKYKEILMKTEEQCKKLYREIAFRADRTHCIDVFAAASNAIILGQLVPYETKDTVLMNLGDIIKRMTFCTVVNVESHCTATSFNSPADDGVSYMKFLKLMSVDDFNREIGYDEPKTQPLTPEQLMKKIFEMK